MKPAQRRQLGLGSGGLLGISIVVWLCLPGWEHLHAPGPMNTQHGEVACEGCHRSAPGTVRQQMQNVARRWAGLDAVAEDIGFRAVSNDECIACHDRPDDRHPVYRFLEPRFAEARAALHPENCSSCHREHNGMRVTVAEITYCQHCHADTAVENDPLDVSHRELIADERWETCLGCHDFHGNHGMKAPLRLQDRIPEQDITTYFRGGPSPYPDPIRRATQPKGKM